MAVNKKASLNPGVLWVVATPIGNLEDFSARAIAVLGRCALILAEDTRHSAILLAHFHLKKPMLPLHKFNEQQQTKMALQRLKGGEDLALISDAGTPLISDPGAQLIKACHQEGIKVSAVPGPCAAITALSLAALGDGSFSFIGFLPPKTKGRLNRLKELAAQAVASTLVFYEAPHRLLACLENLKDVLGAECRALVAKELTKVHETYYLASLSEQLDFWSNQNLKGEWVIVVERIKVNKEALSVKSHLDAKEQQLLEALLEQLPPKKAIKIVSEFTSMPVKSLYQQYLDNKS